MTNATDTKFVAQPEYTPVDLQFFERREALYERKAFKAAGSIFALNDFLHRMQELMSKASSGKECKEEIDQFFDDMDAISPDCSFYVSYWKQLGLIKGHVKAVEFENWEKRKENIRKLDLPFDISSFVHGLWRMQEALGHEATELLRRKVSFFGAHEVLDMTQQNAEALIQAEAKVHKIDEGASVPMAKATSYFARSLKRARPSLK